MKNDIKLRCGVDVISGRDAEERIGEIVEKYYTIGNLCVIFDNNTRNIADNLGNRLSKYGYSVYTKCVEEDSVIPECVKYILGVGSGRVSDEVKIISKERDTRFSFFITSPSTECFVVNRVEKEGIFEDVPVPDALIFDDGVIEDAKDFLVAGGYGRIVAQFVSIFDIEFRRVIFAEKQDDDALDELTSIIYDFEKKKYEGNFNIRLLETLIKIGDIKSYLGIEYEAVDEFARVLCQNSNITMGEASFIATYMILNIYKFFLEGECIDTLIPPDVVKNLKLLEKCRVINYNNYCIERLSYHTYLKESFVVEEYRRDLYDKLKGVDMHTFAKFWRRLYDDAGFWLKSYLSGRELIKYLTISSELTDGTLLKYIKRLGFFERMI